MSDPLRQPAQPRPTPSESPTGPPTNAGTFNFTVQVTDSAAVTATASFSLTMNAVVAAPTQPIPTLGEWGVLVLFALLAVGAVIRLRRR